MNALPDTVLCDMPMSDIYVTEHCAVGLTYLVTHYLVHISFKDGAVITKHTPSFDDARRTYETFVAEAKEIGQ